MRSPKTLLLLILGLFALALAQPASAQNIAWSAASGSPTIPNTKTPGFFFWHVKTEVYLTAEVNNSLKKNQVMEGTITVTLGKITGLVRSAAQSGDYATLVNSTKVTYNLSAPNGRHSLHFKLTGGTLLTLSATYNGAAAGNLIYYGPKATNAKNSPNPVTFNLAQ